MDPSRYQEISDFFKELREEINITATELSRKLDVSPQYISLIETQKKIPGEKLLGKLCALYQLDLNDCLQLRENSIRTIKEKRAIKNSNSNESIIKNKPSIQEGQTGTQNNNAQNNLNPQLTEAFERLKRLGDDIQIQLAKDVNELIESHMMNLIQKYAFKDVKEVFSRTYENWMNQAKNPKYNRKENQGFQEELEGFLELNSESLFFELSSNEMVLRVKTCYKDRHLMENLIKIVPGVKVSQYTTGNLGKVYKNTSINNVFIFNPVLLVTDIQKYFLNNNIKLNNVKFEEFQIEPFFK